MRVSEALHYKRTDVATRGLRGNRKESNMTSVVGRSERSDDKGTRVAQTHTRLTPRAISIRFTVSASAKAPPEQAQGPYQTIRVSELHFFLSSSAIYLVPARRLCRPVACYRLLAAYRGDVFITLCRGDGVHWSCSWFWDSSLVAWRVARHVAETTSCPSQRSRILLLVHDTSCRYDSFLSRFCLVSTG